MSVQDLLECLEDISKHGSPGWTSLESARNAVVKVREFLSQSDEEGTSGTSPIKNGDVSTAKQRIQTTYDDLTAIVNEDDAVCDSRLECGCIAASILQEVLHQLQAAECSRVLPLPDKGQDVTKVPPAPPNLLSVHQTKVVEGAVRVIVYTVVLGCVGTEASLYLKTTLAKSKFVLGQNLVIVPQGRSLTLLIPTLRLLLPVMKHESLGIGIRRSFFPELFTALLELCFSPSAVKSHREDVAFFREQLEEVMNTTNSATILSHFLFLLGFVPAGSWLGRACRALVVRRFLTRAGGVAAVVGAGLTICGGQDWRCCEAVAAIIAYARTRDLNDYYSVVGPQLWDLMQQEDLKPEVVRVVVLTVAQLADRSAQLTGQHVTSQLLQPLYQTTLPNAVDMCKGANLTACLSLVHKMFVEIPPPSPALTGLLQPVLIPLVMTAALHTTHLRSSARHIIIRYLSLMSKEDAVDALFIMSSLKMSPKSPPMNLDVALTVDDSGGIKVDERTDLQKTRNMEEDENIAKCLISILELLKNSAVVLLFYERLTKHIDFTVFNNKKEETPNLLLTDDDIRADQFEKMRRILLSCSLLENLSESELVTNDLFMNLSAAVPLVSSLIRIGCQVCEEEQVQLMQASLVMNVLMLVSCYVSDRTLKKKMSMEDWKGLKTLLPTLKEVMDVSSDEAVLLLVEQLKNLVLTHGVVSVEPSSLAEAKKSKENAATLYRKKGLCDIAASYDTNLRKNEPIVKKEINNVTRPDMKTNRNDSSKETQKENHKELETCSDKDNASNSDYHFRTEPNVDSKNVIKDQSHLTRESNSNHNSTMVNSVDPIPEGGKVNSHKEEGSYQEAMEDLFSPLLPVRGHALLALGKLLDRRDKEALAHSQQLLSIFQHNLKEDDSYLYLMAVEGLAVLCDAFPKKVVEILTREFSMGERSGEDRAKLAEVLVRATRRLGPLLPHYRDLFINSLLNGMKAREGMVRAASFSALGDVCRLLKFSLGPVVQEIFCVLYDAVKGDEAPEVRGAAVLVVTLLLQGLGEDTFTVLRDVIRDLYRLLRLVHSTDPDLTVRLHAQVAMEEVDAATRRFLMPRLSLTKRIYVTEMPRTTF